MESPSSEVKKQFAALISNAVKKLYPDADIGEEQIAISISVPKKEFGDISSSISLRLAKVAKKSPGDIAKEMVGAISALEKREMFSGFSEAGGYINASVGESAYTKAVIEAVEKQEEWYGCSDIGKGVKVIAEYPSLNPNKPYVVSHLRNALLGDSISNILEFCSYTVEREDYIDNLGLQMAETLWGWRNISDKPEGKFDQWLGEQYVLVNQKLEEGGEPMKAQIKALLKTIEDTDTEDSKLLRSIAERCLKAQRETLFNYGIYHDVLIWESDIIRAKLLEKAMALGFEKGIFEKPADGKYAGCVVVKLDKITKFAKELEGSREDSKVMVRSNGAATYIAKDFAFHLWKFGLLGSDFTYAKFMDQPNGERLFTTAPEGAVMGFGKVNKVVNVIAEHQSYEQKIIKVLFNLMGRHDIAENLVHLSYGMVSLEGIKLSTRKGTWRGKDRDYTADVLLEEAQSKALEATKQSKKLSSPEKAEEISESIGLSAIRFEFLKMSPQKPIVFSWDNALSFEGNSGPYCLYSYARANRILKKAGYRGVRIGDGQYSKVTRGNDFELVKLIGSAKEHVEKAAAEYSPNIIVEYIADLTTSFSRFYESMPVINSDAAEFRLGLVYSYMITLKNMLALLGIRTVEEM